MTKLCKLWQNYVNYGKNMVTFNKTPLGETGCLGILYFLLTGVWTSSFLIYCSNLVNYKTPCHAIGHTIAFYPYYSPERQRISLGVATILSMCLCSHT